GRCMERGIVMIENDSMSGIAAEYSWIEEEMREYGVVGEAVLKKNESVYEGIDVENEGGEIGWI
uniref:hypothetical protein n=1 Tax=Neisseria sicca TaxID=490 RepID=UPI003F68B631